MSVLWSVVLGVVVAAIFMGSTPVILSRFTKTVPLLTLALALAFIWAKFTIAFVLVIWVFRSQTFDDHLNYQAFGFTLGIASLLWIMGYTWRFRTKRTPIYDLPHIQ